MPAAQRTVTRLPRHGSSAQLGVRASTDLTSFRTDWSTSTQLTMQQFAWQRDVTRDVAPSELSVDVDVAGDAETLELALVITGDGVARFGPVSVEAG
jgi:hypothetical protein